MSAAPGDQNGSFSGRIRRLDVTQLSWQSLGLPGRLHGWIRKTPKIGKTYFRIMVGVFLVGAASSLLHAAAGFVMPAMAKRVEDFVRESGLFNLYLYAFAAVFFLFLLYSLLHGHSIFFQSNFSLRRNWLFSIIPRPWKERLVPLYEVPRSRIWGELVAIQRAAGRDAGSRYWSRVVRSWAALAVAVTLFGSWIVHVNLEVKSEEYRALLQARPWIKALPGPALFVGFFFLAEFFRLRRPEAQNSAIRLRAWMYRAAGAALLLWPFVIRSGKPVLGGTFFDRLPGPIQVVAGLAFIGGWLGGAWYLFSRAHFIMGARVTDVRASDARAPVVLFRSFGDDNLQIGRAFENVTEDLRDPETAMRLQSSDSVVSFEETIERQVRDYAPLIAVGQPGVFRRGGAIREYYDSDKWHAAVLEWMDAAQFIVVISSWTPGLRWELRNIIARGGMRRLILLLPPGDQRAARWAFLVGCFSGTPWSERLKSEGHERVLAMHWVTEEEAIFLCSDHEGDRDYEVALHLAVYGIRHRISPTGRGA